MRRSLTIITIMLMATSLFASYSIALPERGIPHFSVISDDGDTIALDDYIWYKRWNGLLLERIDDGIYSVDEDGSSVLLIEEGADIVDIRDALRFNDGIELMISALPILDTDAMEDEGVKDVIIMTRLSERERVRLEALGFDIEERRPGDVVQIGGDGTEEAERVLVTCPYCHRSFSIYL